MLYLLYNFGGICERSSGKNFRTRPPTPSTSPIYNLPQPPRFHRGWYSKTSGPNRVDSVRSFLLIPNFVCARIYSVWHRISPLVCIVPNAANGLRQYQQVIKQRQTTSKPPVQTVQILRGRSFSYQTLGVQESGLFHMESVPCFPSSVRQLYYFLE